MDIPYFLAPAPMNSLEALLVFFEEMQVGRLLEDCQLVKLERTPPFDRYRFGHTLIYYQQNTGRTMHFTTGEWCNSQQLEIDEVALGYDDAVACIRAMIASAITGNIP